MRLQQHYPTIWQETSTATRCF